MYNNSVDKEARDKREKQHIMLLVALRKLGGEFSITKEDYEWSKDHNIQVILNGGSLAGANISILKPYVATWPKNSAK